MKPVGCNGMNSFAMSLRLSVLRTRESTAREFCPQDNWRNAHSKGIHSVEQDDIFVNLR